MTYKSPPFLQTGDCLGITSMASSIGAEVTNAAKSHIETNWGLRVKCSTHINDTYFNFAGADQTRCAELQKMLDDPEIKAIFSSRGGYGVSKYIDQLDFSKFIQNPKWIIGFSDITALHFKIQSLGFRSIHGPMPSTFFYDLESLEKLKKLIFGEPSSITAPYHSFNRSGVIKAPIIGGNLCLIAHNIGSQGDIDFEGHILFLEEIGEYAYNIDRMMLQLMRAGKLHKLAGLAVGDFSNTKENDSNFGKSPYEIIHSHVESFNYPVAFGLPIGHEKVNNSIICGAETTFEIDNKQTNLYPFNYEIV